MGRFEWLPESMISVKPRSIHQRFCQIEINSSTVLLWPSWLSHIPQHTTLGDICRVGINPSTVSFKLKSIHQRFCFDQADWAICPSTQPSLIFFKSKSIHQRFCQIEINSSTVLLWPSWLTKLIEACLTRKYNIQTTRHTYRKTQARVAADLFIPASPQSNTALKLDSSRLNKLARSHTFQHSRSPADSSVRRSRHIHSSLPTFQDSATGENMITGANKANSHSTRLKCIAQLAMLTIAVRYQGPIRTLRVHVCVCMYVTVCVCACICKCVCARVFVCM